MTSQGALTVCLEVYTFVEDIYKTSWALKDQVENATSVAQVNDITWPAA